MGTPRESARGLLCPLFDEIDHLSGTKRLRFRSNDGGPIGVSAIQIVHVPVSSNSQRLYKTPGRLLHILQAVRPLFLRTLCVDSMHSRENCHRPAEDSTRQEINCIIPLPTNRDRCWARGRFAGRGDGTDWPMKERGRVPSSFILSPLGPARASGFVVQAKHVRCWDSIDTAIISIAERTGQPMRMGSDQYSENGMAINGARVRHPITTYHSVV
jgi:hypothetical protein